MVVRQVGTLSSEAVSPIVERRDPRLDLLRGFAVLAMVVDHIAGVSPLYAITGGNRFFVSAAEGFVFISGLLVGIVYGDEIRRQGWQAGAKRALRRAFALYALSVWLAVGFALFSTLLGLPWASSTVTSQFGEFLLGVVAFQRTYYLVDVMQLYALLLLVTPAALWLLSRGRARWLLEVSFALWFAYQLTGGRPEVPWHIEDNVVFKFAPWQLLFFSAMALGHERNAVASWWHQRRATPRWYHRLPGGWLGPLALALDAMILLHVTNGEILGRLGLVAVPASALDAWFDKASLPPLRLLAISIVFAFAWNLVSRGWPLVRRTLGWLLLPLGSRALYAYAAHVFVAGAIQATLSTLTTRTGSSTAADPSPGLSLAAQVAGLAAVWVVVRWEAPRRLLGRLGDPPLARPARAAGLLVPAWIWRPTASLVAMVGLWVAGAAASDLKWPNTTPSPVLGAAYASTGGPAGQAPRFEPTVTAARRIADLGPNPAEQLRTEIAAAPAPPHEGTRAAASPARVAVPSVLDDRSLQSRTLGRTMQYGMYLPPGYSRDCARRFPVVYLLHGAPNNYTEWPRMGIQQVADRLIASGEAQPMIMVFPQGDGSYFFNHQGGPAWGDYIAHDVVGHVDATVCTIPDRAHRVIAGLSAGGHGALQLALNYPNVFGIVAAHGPAIRRYQERTDLFGTAAYYERYDPIALAETAGTAPSRIWLDAGDKDPWSGPVLQLAEIFRRRGWPATTRIYPGEHNTGYWLDHLPEYLRFYSQSLAR